MFQSSSFRVKSISTNGVYRTIMILSDTGKQSQLKLHRFSLVGPGDRIHVDSERSSRLFISSNEDARDLIPLTPHFEYRQCLLLGSKEYEVVIKEIITQADLDEYDYLEGFHYKTSSAIVTEESNPDKGSSATGGRKSVLLAYVRVGKRLMPAGYIELQMPLLMVKPRHELFANKYHHPNRPIAWEKWDAQSMSQNVNLIVRIARVVTSPDLRGLGIARLLIGVAKEFAKDRWHIKGRRPLFIEISAEMLKYMDFATSAGLHFIGYTEGNLTRIHKDLIQMQRGQKMSFGMMTLQHKYLTQLKRLSKEIGQPFPEVLSRLKELTEHKGQEALRTKLNDLKPQEWSLFRKVLRFPIPYFLCGLDEYSENYVVDNKRADREKLDNTSNYIKAARICLNDIRVTSAYQIPDSPQARAIRDCFGLDGNIFKVRLVGPVTIEATGGNIILITGPSGSGKSVLLRVLDPNFKSELLEVSYRNGSDKSYDIDWMNDIESEKPLIEYFSELWGIESSISALNQAGLSEAFIYLRPYRLLSRGQQYRARVAALSLGSAPVWLMDEFCADLDPFTARIVAINLRKHIIRSGRIAIIAAANNAHYIDALRPTKVIYLRYNGRTEVFSYKEYVDEFCLDTK